MEAYAPKSNSKNTNIDHFVICLEKKDGLDSIGSHHGVCIHDTSMGSEISGVFPVIEHLVPSLIWLSYLPYLSMLGLAWLILVCSRPFTKPSMLRPSMAKS